MNRSYNIFKCPDCNFSTDILLSYLDNRINEIKKDIKNKNDLLEQYSLLIDVVKKAPKSKFVSDLMFYIESEADSLNISIKEYLYNLFEHKELKEWSGAVKEMQDYINDLRANAIKLSKEIEKINERISNFYKNIFNKKNNK